MNEPPDMRNLQAPAYSACAEVRGGAGSDLVVGISPCIPLFQNASKCVAYERLWEGERPVDGGKGRMPVPRRRPLSE